MPTPKMSAPELGVRELRASVHGPMPGTDPLESAKMVLGELGDPHLPALIELPDRGRFHETLGRTVSLMDGLSVDIQSYGWRITDAAGKDFRSAISARNSDLGIMADLIGASETRPSTLKIQFLGPLSLAASVHLHLGEKAISDTGALRDLSQSLSSGIAEFVRNVRRATGVSGVVVLVNEPQADAALAGAIRTVSGYRTLRAIDRANAVRLWADFVGDIKDDDAASVVLNLADDRGDLGTAHAETLGRFAEVGADAWYIDVVRNHSKMAVWEGMASLIEADREVWLGALDPARSRESVGDVFERIVKPWRNVGLSFPQLHRTVVLPTAGLNQQSPEQALRTLGRLTDLVDAGRQRIVDA